MDRIYTNEEYSKLVDKKSPPSKLGVNMLKAFVVGGLICVVGQMINDGLKAIGLGTDMASGVTSILMILAGALLTGFNVYDEIGRAGGAGAIVPITGFANSVVSPAMEFKSEGYVMGVGARMFTVAGPVLVYGISASVVVGIIYFLVGFGR